MAGPESVPDRAPNWRPLRKPLRPDPPKVEDEAWNAHPIDRFIRRRLEEKGLSPAPPADRRTLIRRAYLDLIGLLPDPEDVDAFVNDSSPTAFENVIERLLESQHYGERWGRHWLDVVRYADSHGYEHDYDFPNAWRYRDYVIRAFNQDKPYNDFILEQLAGDELDQPSHDSLIATGFYRIGPRVGFREKDNPQYRYNYLDDMIATTSRGFMGLTVDCARCHDHKFDPIRQRDYYRMLAIFFPHVNYDYPLAPAGQVASYEAQKRRIEESSQPLKRRIAEIEEPYRAIAFERRLEGFPEEIQIAVRTPEQQRTPGQKLLADQVVSIGSGSVKSYLSSEHRAEIEELRARIQEIEKDLPAELPLAMGIRDGDYRFAPNGLGDQVLPGKGEREVFDFEGSFLPEEGKPFQFPKAHLLPTGDYHTKGPAVEPGFLEVIAPAELPTAHPPANGHVTTGFRRAFAEWLISDEHPLTARVMVNRIWGYHFGRGIVTTASNFGKLGRPPTHPELLDWLAIEFRERGWSIKQMHRLILTSRTYRMSSRATEDSLKIDPENELFSRFPQRRLEGEIVRDAILSASGKLNPQFGGEPYFPPIPESVWQSFGKGKWLLTSEGPAVWRRSIYSYWKRGLQYPMFEVFDQPNSNLTCERRNTTTVPTQALTLLNSEFVLLQAKLFAERVLSDVGIRRERQIRRAYRIALSRDPSEKELSRNIAFLDDQTSHHSARGSTNAETEALIDLCDVILNLSEFVYMN
ncbi:MAG: DUF1553 domain-containing protein [bacterium]